MADDELWEKLLKQGETFNLTSEDNNLVPTQEQQQRMDGDVFSQRQSAATNAQHYRGNHQLTIYHLLTIPLQLLPQLIPICPSIMMKKTRVVGQESDQVPNVEDIASCSNSRISTWNWYLDNVYYLSVCVKSEILANKPFHSSVQKSTANNEAQQKNFIDAEDWCQMRIADDDSGENRTSWQEF